MPDLQNCRELDGDDPDFARNVVNLKALCASNKQELSKIAVFARSACPTAGVIASCKQRGATDFYYRGFEPALDDTEAQCEQTGGTFTRTTP